MPQSIQDAVISAEDRSFYTNSGIDFKGIIRAAWTNLRSDSVEQGASTITQQYVKILYLTQERTWKRKIKEAFLAAKLSNELTKDEILEGYLNTIYFGRGAYGIQAAAAGVLRQGRQGPDRGRERRARLGAQLAERARPGQRQGRARRAARRATSTSSTAWSSIGNARRGRGREVRDSCRSSPRSADHDQYGGQKGYLMTLVRQQLQGRRLHREQTSTAAASRSSRPSTGRPSAPPARRSRSSGPTGSTAAARRPGLGRAGHRARCAP